MRRTSCILYLETWLRVDFQLLAANELLSVI